MADSWASMVHDHHDDHASDGFLTPYAQRKDKENDRKPWWSVSTSGNSSLKEKLALCGLIHGPAGTRRGKEKLTLSARTNAVGSLHVT